MKIGVPKEVKPDEYRVAIMPVGVDALVQAGHEVLVERHAGVGSGFSDDDYAAAGATLMSDHKKLFADADMILKVKEPQPEEFDLFKPGQIVFTYFHFA